MIEETAFVVAVQGDYALLQTQRRSACQSCSVKQGCGTSVLSRVVGQRSTQLSVINTLSAQVGEEVIIGLEENALVQGSLLVYSLPLVMLLVFALLGEYWARSQGLSSEWLVIVSAALGFLLSLLVIRLGFFSSKLSRRIQPQMLRRVHTSNGGRDTIPLVL